MPSNVSHQPDIAGCLNTVANTAAASGIALLDAVDTTYEMDLTKVVTLPR